MSTKPSIGFCGLGAMGFGMATHLVKQGYPVTGFDVHPPSLTRFQSAGGNAAGSLSASAQDQAFYMVMVASEWQVQAALFGKDDGIVAALPRGATLVVCSTVPSGYVERVARQLAAVGRADVFLLDAPVSGGVARAADGALSIMAGAGAAAMERGTWLLQELAAPSKLYVVPGGVGAGSNMKMVHQVLAAIHILAASEAYGLAARLGLHGQDVFDAVVAGPGWSFMFESRSPRTLTDAYLPSASAITIILKDTVRGPRANKDEWAAEVRAGWGAADKQTTQGIITSTARKAAFPASLCSVAEQVFFSAVDRGWGANDDAGLVRLWTSEPVTRTPSALSAEEKASKLQLIVNLLVGIHLVSAAEALSLAKRVGIPLPQFYELACDAAGGSTMFKEMGKEMIAVLEGREDGSGSVLGGYAETLKTAAMEAQNVKCPLYLGAAALDKLLQTGPAMSVASLLKCYGV